MSKETTDALMIDFRRNTRGVVSANNLRVMPNARYSPGNQNTRIEGRTTTLNTRSG